MEKTQWGTQIIVFLGLLINMKSMTISVPLETNNREKKDYGPWDPTAGRALEFPLQGILPCSSIYKKFLL